MPIITYPGITGVVSLEGTPSVGITPASFGLTCFYDSAPSITGTLVIGDGTNANITLPNCKRDYQEQMTSQNQDYLMVRLLDRRWAWKEGFCIDGHYNQLAESKKFIPWRIASPYQMGRLLLAKMGEYSLTATLATGTIDLPGGLASPGVAGVMPNPGPDDRIVDSQGDYLNWGQNLLVSRTNPTELWESQPAALALANLCDKFGRVVVLDFTTNLVRVVKLGTGTALPTGGVWVSNGVSVTGDSIPDRILVRGAPTRFQFRVALRQVLKEWDSTWVTESRCSYSPARASQTMVVWMIGTYNSGWSYVLVINGVTFTVAAGAGSFAAVIAQFVTLIGASTNPAVLGKVTASNGTTKLILTGYQDGYEFEVLTTGSTAPPTVGSGITPVYGWLAECQAGPITGATAQQKSVTFQFGPYVVGNIFSVTINGTAYTNSGVEADAIEAIYNICALINADVGAAVTANCNQTTLIVTGKVAGTNFTYSSSTTGAGPTVTTLVSGTSFTPKGFERAWGRFGWAARSTPQLTQKQAAALAEYSVRRTYQIIGVNPADPTDKNIPTPGYTYTSDVTGLPIAINSIDNRYRIIPQGSRPEPVTPVAGDAAVIDTATGLPYSAEQYRGFSHDRQNIAYGSIWTPLLDGQGLHWTLGEYMKNTPKRSYLPMPFQFVDAERGVVQFSSPVYRMLGLSQSGRPNGAACLPSDIVIEIGCQILDHPSGVPARFTYVRNIGGFAPTIERVYPDVQLEVIGLYDANHVVTGSRVLDDDAANRAEYYADSLADALQLSDGIGRRYEGILSIPLDGLVRQVGWSISEAGCFTTASSNSEYSRIVPPYQVRRRAENLTFDTVRSQQNLLSDFRLRGEIASAIKRISAGLYGAPR